MASFTPQSLAVDTPRLRQGDWVVSGSETVRGERIRLDGNLTLRRADPEQPAGISMYALYFSGDKTDVSVRGATHICELMHRGGKLRLAGTPEKNELSIGCTTLEVSGGASMTVENVHLGRPLHRQDDPALGEANVADTATLTGRSGSVRNVRFHTRDKGRVALTSLARHGRVEVREEGGRVELE